MAAVRLRLLVVLLAARAQTGTALPPSSAVTGSPTPSLETPSTATEVTTASTAKPTTTVPVNCPEIGLVQKNNWLEDEQGYIISATNAVGVTGVSWAPYDPARNYTDIRSYVTPTLNQSSQAIDFTVTSSMEGVRDYPAEGYPNSPRFGGICQMTCGSDTGTFEFILIVKDQNTATPTFDSSSYNVDVYESFPVGFTIPDLTISASDADADARNYKISFKLQEGSPFSLTESKRPNPESYPPTYTADLVLNEQLDWKATPSYDLTITAEDPGNLSTVATIKVKVIDTDTLQPEFDRPVYSTIVEDPESMAPLPVTIKATDPDVPGKVKYEALQDTSGGQFADYFSLDPDTAELSLIKNITDMLQPYETTVTFLLEATEDGGYGFKCRSALVVTLPAAAMTTTTEPPTSTTPMTSTEPSSSTTPVTSTTSETPTSTSPATATPSTSPSTDPTATTPSPTPDMSTSTPASAPTSTDTTVVTSTDITGTTPVTSPTTPVTSGTPSSTLKPTSTPTPSPLPCPLFEQRQYPVNGAESYIGELVTVQAAEGAHDVTYFLRTPGYEDSFFLDETTGTLNKTEKLGYQKVSLLVQAIPAGGSKKDQTNDTDTVDWDETLIIVDVTDENDSPPVLNCAAYADSCDSVAIGFPASETATLPAPLLRLTATDADTGAFGVDGIKYSVDSTAVKIDSSGMLYLVKQQPDAFSVTVTAEDNYGDDSPNSAAAKIMLVPIGDKQVFFISTDSQLTDATSVTSLLDQVAQKGNYRAVFSLDFQAFGATDTAPPMLHLSDDAGGSTIYIYALRQGDDGTISAVDSGDIEGSLDKMDKVDYIETKDDQMSGGGPSNEESNTGLIVAVAVLACLLVAVIAAAAFRQRQLLKRSTASYSKQKNDTESYTGAVTNANYSHSPHDSRRQSVAPSGANTYSNHAFQPSEQPGSDSVFRSAPFPRPDEEHHVSSAPRPATPPATATATLIDIAEPPAEPEPEPEEPTPDYSLKSVGFKETVICVSPPLEPHEEEEEDEEEEGEDEEGEKNEEEAGQEKTEIDDVAEKSSVQGDARESSDGEREDAENSML